uniref:Probable nicotinate-nucleotide adenylyltransferase n=1 Tax=Magnetococcus massalia (strain MO-1) TaxID=451514 RepID=A0A1S7LK09_MAGMO|nr:Putative nicotinate-nucleotide adenylyltransferase [Candidatus Magnetococcus massalia]
MTDRPQRIGLLGGSFNPPHHGHIQPALDVLQGLQLGALHLLPSGDHPFKRDGSLIAAEHRLAMLQCACVAHTGLQVDAREVRRNGINYTIDTLQELAEEAPEIEWVFLMGSDLLQEFHLWKSWQQLLHFAHLCIMTRAGHPLELAATEGGRYLQSHMETCRESFIQQRYPGPKKRVIVQTVTPLNISSTALRRAIATGQTTAAMMPKAVADYIEQQELYR